MTSYMFTPGGVFKFVDPSRQKTGCAGYFENYADMIIKCAKAGSGISDRAEQINIIRPEKEDTHESVDRKSSTDLTVHRSRTRTKRRRKTSKLLIKTKTGSAEGGSSDGEDASKSESSDYATANPRNNVNLQEGSSEEVALKARRVLADLQEKMIKVLNRSCTSVEKVCDRVRRKGRESRASKSDPLRPTQVGSATDTTNELRNALKVGLVQTQSENQIRLAVSTSKSCLKVQMVTNVASLFIQKLLQVK